MKTRATESCPKCAKTFRRCSSDTRKVRGVGTSSVKLPRPYTVPKKTSFQTYAPKVSVELHLLSTANTTVLKGKVC